MKLRVLSVSHGDLDHLNLKLMFMMPVTITMGGVRGVPPSSVTVTVATTVTPRPERLGRAGGRASLIHAASLARGDNFGGSGN